LDRNSRIGNPSALSSNLETGTILGPSFGQALFSTGLFPAMG